MKSAVVLLLTLISSCAVAQEAREDFDQFCRKFFTDRQFQLSRIAFPLVSIQPNEDGEGVDTLSLDRAHWQFERYGWGEKAKKGSEGLNERVYDNFQKKQSKILRNTDERVASLEGIDNGISVQCFFRLRGGKWIMVRHEDWSN
jgi:hypothetical protein